MLLGDKALSIMWLGGFDLGKSVEAGPFKTELLLPISLERSLERYGNKEVLFMEMNKDAYNAYVKEVTPVNPVWKNIVRAFVTGGIICTIGQVVINWLISYGLDEKAAGAWNLLVLILGSIVLTGFNVYPKIVKWGGAGALVPITGFANSVVSPAIEYKAEGQIFGIGCKIFTIAGPVILYGILSSWVLGVIYWIGGYLMRLIESKKII